VSTVSHETDQHSQAHGEHSHAHGEHSHAHAPEPSLPPSGTASVVLDIGGDIGALLVNAPARFLGTEPELTALDGIGGTTHTSVRERRTDQGVHYVAVFPALRAGDYVFEPTGQTVTVTGGAVSELTATHVAWRSEPTS